MRTFRTGRLFSESERFLFYCDIVFEIRKPIQWAIKVFARLNVGAAMKGLTRLSRFADNAGGPYFIFLHEINFRPIILTLTDL